MPRTCLPRARPRSLSARGAAVALACALPLLAAAGNPPDADFSAHEVPQHAAPGSPRYVIGAERPTWPGAVVNYYYNPSGQPAGLTTATVLQALAKAARKWENLCNVRFNYLGTHSAAPNLDATFSTIDRLNVIGWQLLGGSRASYSGYVAWWWSGASLVDADMVLNTAFGAQLAGNPRELEALATHEMGHMLAISHSNVQQSVMFANPYNSYAFQTTLRGDDAAACASLYGTAPHARANRIFNWAEQTFAPFIAPTGAVSQDLEGYHYRFYPATGSFLAEQGGALLYLPAGGPLIPLGSVDATLPAAAAAGF